MKTKLIYLTLLISIQLSYSQIEPEWVIRYSSPFGRGTALGVVVDNTGSVYITGYIINQGGDSDFITIKYSSDGIEQWVQTYNGPANGADFAIAIAIDDYSNVYVTGSSKGIGSDEDYATIKYNTDGVQQWVRRYNGTGNDRDEPSDIAVDTSGNVFVTGRSDGIDFNKDYATIKYSSDGDELWVKRYDGPNNNGDGARAIAVDKFGNVYVTGESSIDNINNSDYTTIAYGPNGNLLWLKKYNGPGSGTDAAQAITVDTLGNVYVTGGSWTQQGVGAYATIKYSSTGTEIWVQRWNNLPGHGGEAKSIAVDDDGNVYVTGAGAATIKYNTNGGLEWAMTPGGTTNVSIGYDPFGNVYVTGYEFVSNQSYNYRTIKYNSDGEQEWLHSYNGPGSGEDKPNSLVVDQQGNVYVTGYSTANVTAKDITTIKYSGIKYPVFIVPGIAGTYAADTQNDLPWIMTRGINPNLMQVDPLGKVYTDMITTFENLGYEQGKNLFVVNYDWRLTPGPIDNNIDGHIDGLSGVSITSGQFNYGIDYLGWYIKQACEKFRLDYGMELDSIDVIAHSTGGLVTRTYIQSNAYGDVYDISNNYKLPKIRNFVMIGVPNRGASKAWNPIHDNWIADIAYQFVLSKIVNSAYQKVLQNQTITGPDYNITKSDILDSLGNPSKTKFLNKYVPTLRYLLATYDFINFGSGLTNVNNDIEIRNTIVLDLNNGFDINPLNDPNDFLDSANVTVVYGTGESTSSQVLQRTDFEFNASQSFTDWAPRNSLPGTVWYKDISISSNGDATVPTISSAGQFLIDNRANKLPFSSGDHTGLVSMVNVQSSILDLLNIPFTENNISTGSSADIENVLNVISDPVELFITDGSGNRLGYSNTTGAVTEIPNSIWFGNTDGRGWVFGSVQEPINLELTGLGEDYYVMVSVEDSGKGGGVVLEGFLGLGEVINYQITLEPLSVDQIKSLTPENFELAQNYPNPFNPVTTIQYSIPQRSNVTLKVYDVLGNEIAALVNEEKLAGVYEVDFNASNLSSGVYFYKLQGGSFVETKKMILLR